MVKLNLVLSTVQAHTTASNCQGQLVAYQAIQQAIQTFVADSENLKGQAYDSARAYYSAVLLPISQGAELYVETAETSMKNLPSECTAKCGAFLLDTEEVERLIQNQATSISALELQYDCLRASSVPMEAKKSNLAYMAKQVEIHQGIKKELEEQLQKLFDFDAYSPQIFSEADALKADLEKGLSQTENSWDASSQSFIISEDLAWARHLSTLHSLKDTNYTVQEKEFIYNLQEQYGFDLETAGQIVQVKRGIDKEFPDRPQSEKDYLLLRIIGAANYDGLKWNETAGYLGGYFNYPSPLNGEKVPLKLVEILKKLGLDEKKIPEFLYNLRLQHELSGADIKEVNITVLKREKMNDYNDYKQKMEGAVGHKLTDKNFEELWTEKLAAFNGKNDFTHQSITMATHLYDNQFRLANLLGGHENTNKLSGWKGDVTMAAGANPSMKDDDYKADLDSVNLIHRMAKGQSYLEASRQYYQDLGAEKINRAKEFLDNMGGIDKVKDEVYSTLPDNVEYDEKTESYKLKEKSDGEAEAFIKDYPLQFGDTDRFLRALEQEANSLTELK
ncbi:hypothetical protein [Streptococcus oricebi]|uniref:LXG domain-containing protein n=1 Tax=Streptococcus oricebi TaxID=1547447 RepID=A0ABS5B4J9_9STRE|nr:hypothetical protein [Streptococcus oricebi]MBP2623752.1 hypothetical protein [Streptococcus oricebi]